MGLRSILRDGLGSVSRRAFESWRKDKRNDSVDLGVDDGVGNGDVSDGGGGRSWAGLQPELLREVVRRLEEKEAAWPGRKNVVACGSVCRSWRAVCKEIVGAPETTGKLTFLVALKQDITYNEHHSRVFSWRSFHLTSKTYKAILAEDFVKAKHPDLNKRAKVSCL